MRPALRSGQRRQKLVCLTGLICEKAELSLQIGDSKYRSQNTVLRQKVQELRQVKSLQSKELERCNYLNTKCHCIEDTVRKPFLADTIAKPNATVRAARPNTKHPPATRLPNPPHLAAGGRSTPPPDRPPTAGLRQDKLRPK